MIHTQLMQYRRPKVVNGRHVLDRVIAQFIGRSVRRSTLDPASRQPDAETVRVVIPAVTSLSKRRPAKFPRPDDQGFVQQSP